MSVRPITEDDLHALVDGWLDDARRTEVEGYLAGQPEVAARVETYRRQREELRTALAPIAAEPVPPELNPAWLAERRRRPDRSPWRQAAAVVLALGLGAGGGWWLHGQAGPAQAGIATLAQQAADTYDVFATDAQRPVELRADNAPDLLRWASARLGRPVALPDLSTSGFRLMGGRVVATPQGPAFLVMFDDDRGSRLVLLTRRMAEPGSTAMTESPQGPLHAVTWAADGEGYSLVGRLPPRRLHPLADAVRQQLQGV